MRKFFQRTLALLSLTGLLGLSAQAAGGTGYQDITGSEWYASAVQEMTERGLMQGTSPELFSPHNAVDRATAITVLWRLEGSPDSKAAGFSDSAGTWYATAAAWAQAQGIATGYENGTFGGGDTVTREQLATFFYRYALYKGDTLAAGVLTPFSDADTVSDWALTPVRHAVGLGILRGDGDGLLSPKGVATRAALASMLQRLLTPAAG